MTPRLKLFLELLEVGSLPASRLRSSIGDLKTPMASGVLLRRAKGAGEVIEVAKPEAYRAWIGHTFPGAFGGMTSCGPRASNIAMARDSKQGQQGLGHFMVSARAHVPRPDLEPASAKALADLVEATRRWGGASIVLELPGEEGGAVKGPTLPCGARVMTVENPENFCASVQMMEEADVFIFCGSGGRLRNALIDWLAGQPTLQVIHAGDYDPVGLQEFSRLIARMPGRVRLYMPIDLDLRFQKFSNRGLMEKARNRAVMMGIAKGIDPAMDHVIDLIAKFGPMEQESLLINLGSSEI